MSVVRYQSSSSSPTGPVKHSLTAWGFNHSYPTPKTTATTSPRGLQFQRKSRFLSCSPPVTRVHDSSPPTNRHPRDRMQPEQKSNHNSPRAFEIITPSGRKQEMIIVERVCHITTQVEYGLVPDDSKLRKYDEKGNLVGNEGMELLSPKVFEDTPRGTFFFAERRPISDKPREKKKEEDLHEKEKKKSKRDSKDKKEKDPDAAIPTLLEQLVKLGVLKIIPTVRCKSIQHNGACLVRILLSDSEIGHSCSSPRHPYFLYEAPHYARFKVCTSCRAIPYRRGVFYCSEACLAADWKQHRIECGKSRDQLLHIISMLPTIIRPKPPAPAHLRVQTHRPLWYRAWLWMGYAQQTNKDNVIDLKDWKFYVKERKVAGCRDLLPGF